MHVMLYVLVSYMYTKVYTFGKRRAVLHMEKTAEI